MSMNVLVILNYISGIEIVNLADCHINNTILINMLFKSLEFLNCWFITGTKKETIL